MVGRCKLRRVARAKLRAKRVSLEQAQELLRAAAGSRLCAYVVLSVTTGLRTEELRALRWTEVDLDAGIVAVYRAVRSTADTKTPKSRRILSLPRLAVQALHEQRVRQAEDRLRAGALWQDHDLVFASAVGTIEIMKEIIGRASGQAAGDIWREASSRLHARFRILGAGKSFQVRSA